MTADLPVDVLAKLPKGSLSVEERNRFVRFPAERAGLQYLAFQRALDDYNNKWPANEGVPPRAICMHCGRIFKTSRAGQIYCSDDCADRCYNRTRNAKPDAAVVDTADPLQPLFSPRPTSTFRRLSVSLQATCDYCGRQFRPKRSSARFCTDRCRLRHHRRSRVTGGTP